MRRAAIVGAMLAVLAVPPLAFSAPARDVPPWLAAEYSGKYAGTPFLKDFLGDLPRIRKGALARAERRAGVAPAEPDRIAIRLLDAESLPEAELKKWKRAVFHVARGEEPGSAVVTLFLEPFASGEAVPETALARAFVKAVFLARFAEKELKEIPDWIVEGLALYAGGDDEGEAVVERILAARRKPVETLLGDLEGKHEPSDLAQDFWAFLWLEKEKGRKTVAAFGQAVLDGKPYDATLMGLTGKGWGGITQEVTLFAKRELAPIAAGTEAWKALEAKVRATPEEERFRLAGEIAELVTKHRHAWWADKARYLTGRCLEEGRRWDAASEVFEDLAESVPPRGPLAADARWRWGLVLAERGRLEEAERQLAFCVRDHFEEPFVDGCLESLAEIAGKRRDPERAKVWRAALSLRKAEKEKKKDGKK